MYDLLAARHPVHAKTAGDGEVLMVGAQLRQVSTTAQVVKLLQVRACVAGGVRACVVTFGCVHVCVCAWGCRCAQGRDGFPGGAAAAPPSSSTTSAAEA